jgi:site-specific recombinase XerD
VDEWIEEREQDGINNVKAVYLTKRLVAWCKRKDIRHLGQIQTQALGHWRTTEWKYAHGDSASMKIHWSVLGAFFEWCVERRLLEFNPRPKLKGKIKPKEVTPFTPEQIELLLQTSDMLGLADELRVDYDLNLWANQLVSIASDIERKLELRN